MKVLNGSLVHGCLALAMSCAAWTPARAGDLGRRRSRRRSQRYFRHLPGTPTAWGRWEAARMAAEDFNGGGKNIKVEIVYADHQNKADVGTAIVRKVDRRRQGRCGGRRAELRGRSRHQRAAARERR